MIPLAAVSRINYSRVGWAEAGNILTSIVIQARNYGGLQSKVEIVRTETEGPGLKFTFQRLSALSYYPWKEVGDKMTSPRS